MAFASTLLPASPSRVCAGPAPVFAAFSPAKKGVSLAAARRRGSRHGVRAEANQSGSALAVDALSQVKHVLLPVTDRNPYLSEGTRQVYLYLQNISIPCLCLANFCKIYVLNT
uniref:Uncharacterized protein n=1 Tax=Arundo donax TaxID=35708 RepID=A0A0A9DWR6_ARUDO